MTVAICLLCGKMKFGAWTPCQNCGHEPEHLEDRAKHLMLSDHYHSRQDLERFAERISKGERWFFDEQTTQGFIEEMARAEQEDDALEQSWGLIEEYRQGLDQEELEFYDSLPEYSQAVTARLDLYQQYSFRVDEAGKEGGWQAAQAEFNKILDEDSRLRPLEIKRLKSEEIDDWMIVHP